MTNKILVCVCFFSNTLVVTSHIFHIIGTLLDKNYIINLNIKINTFINVFKNILFHKRSNKNIFVKITNKIK